MYIQWRLERVGLRISWRAVLVESINMPCLVKEDMVLSNGETGKAVYANNILLYIRNKISQ